MVLRNVSNTSLSVYFFDQPCLKMSDEEDILQLEMILQDLEKDNERLEVSEIVFSFKQQR